MPTDAIYLDYHATTPVDPRVVAAMLPYFSEEFGNPGSTHRFGESAQRAVEMARGTIADAIGAEPSEIVFTSGATESNNLAIRGVAERSRRRGNHLVATHIEHPSVLEPLERLTARGFELTLVDVQPHGSPAAGQVDPTRIAEALTDQTCLVSVMLANNEIGVVEPLRAIAEICKARGVLLHCDATQAVGRVPVDVLALDVDLLSFSAHKLYGPKGVGALYVRRRNPVVRLAPLTVGGGQERGRRSGTLNTAGIVGFGEAVRLAVEELPREMPRLAALRGRLAETLLASVPAVELVGPDLSQTTADGLPLRLPGNLNIMFRGLDGEALMLAMPELAVSSGAACSSASDEPSHVLRALGLSADEARSCLRFGLGRMTSEEEISRAATLVAGAAAQVGGMTGG